MVQELSGMICTYVNRRGCTRIDFSCSPPSRLRPALFRGTNNDLGRKCHLGHTLTKSRQNPTNEMAWIDGDATKIRQDSWQRISHWWGIWENAQLHPVARSFRITQIFDRKTIRHKCIIKSVLEKVSFRVTTTTFFNPKLKMVSYFLRFWEWD